VSLTIKGVLYSRAANNGIKTVCNTQTCLRSRRKQYKNIRESHDRFHYCFLQGVHK